MFSTTEVEYRLLRGTHGQKEEEATANFEKLNDDRLHSLYYDYQIEKDEMSRSCGTHGRDEKCVQNVCWKSWRKEQI
jgi:hypothetical protein